MVIAMAAGTLARSNRTLLPDRPGAPSLRAGSRGKVSGPHMRPYEVMVILEPALEESAVQQLINRSTELLTKSSGTVNRVEKWGKRRLAYELNHRTEGYYVLFDVTSDVAPIDELDRTLRLADDVLRHKIVRIPEQAAGRKLPAGTTPAAPKEENADG
jgi:small subunit ribosomal protein S6